MFCHRIFVVSVFYSLDAVSVHTAARSHQSVKKAGVKQPSMHVSVDNSSDDVAEDHIEQSVEQPSVVAASLVVGSLIVVPLSVALLVTVCTRLYRQGASFILLYLSLVE